MERARERDIAYIEALEENNVPERELMEIREREMADMEIVARTGQPDNHAVEHQVEADVPPDAPASPASAHDGNASDMEGMSQRSNLLDY